METETLFVESTIFFFVRDELFIHPETELLDSDLKSLLFAIEEVLDEDGNPIGVVMPDGTIVNANGDVVGAVDESGNVVKKGPMGKVGKLWLCFYRINMRKALARCK